MKLGTQMEYEDPYQRQASLPTRSKVNVVRSRDASDRCWAISRERIKSPRNTTIGRKVAQPPRNKMHQFQGQRSKVKVTRSTNAETRSASYLPNGKA